MDQSKQKFITCIMEWNLVALESGYNELALCDCPRVAVHLRIMERLSSDNEVLTTREALVNLLET
jgi:hypothetical protein